MRVLAGGEKSLIRLGRSPRPSVFEDSPERNRKWASPVRASELLVPRYASVPLQFFDDRTVLTVHTI